MFNTKISAFGITDISYKGVGVEDDVKVEVLVPLVKKSSAVNTSAPVTNATKKPVAPKK